MFIYTFKFDRKKTAFCVVVAALLLIGIILLVGAHRKAAMAEQHAASTPSTAMETSDHRQNNKKEITNVKSEKNRVAYLAQYGWEVESPAESECEVMIPRTFSTVFEDYNTLQKRQGFDLSQFCGKEVRMYTYRVTNAPEEFGDEVLAVLYVLNNRVVGGDIHSTALDGKMTGIIRE